MDVKPTVHRGTKDPPWEEAPYDAERTVVARLVKASAEDAAYGLNLVRRNLEKEFAPNHRASLDGHIFDVQGVITELESRLRLFRQLEVSTFSGFVDALRDANGILRRGIEDAGKKAKTAKAGIEGTEVVVAKCIGLFATIAREAPQPGAIGTRQTPQRAPSATESDNDERSTT